MKKSIIISVIIFAQALLAVAAGFVVLSFKVSDRALPKTFVSSIDLGGLSREEASLKVSKWFESDVENNEFIVKYKDESMHVKLNEIDAKLDLKATMDKAFKYGGGTLISLANGYFVPNKKGVTPELTVNESKLAQKLELFSKRVYKEPKDADVNLIEGEIVKIPEVDGIVLDVGKAVEKVKKGISSGTNNTIDLEVNEGIVQKISPKFKLEDIEDVEEIIADFATEIMPGQDPFYMRIAAKAMNKVILPSVDTWFSFNHYLGELNGIMYQNNESYNQVVSTLNAALIKAGVKSIKVTHNKAPVDYIEPGLDAVVFGKTTDYQFLNDLGQTIIIFAKVKDNQVVVSIAGKKKTNLK
ncbi:MAG: VanW family protein [Clostridia bacterium]|nr:VanW family protein [Clostridia bacterium]